MLVSRLDAFAQYQREKAWVFEHQALTRARFIAGDAAIGAAFERLRVDILRLAARAGTAAAGCSRDARTHAGGHPNRSGCSTSSTTAAGIVDVEFIVQYLVLALPTATPS